MRYVNTHKKQLSICAVTPCRLLSYPTDWSFFQRVDRISLRHPGILNLKTSVDRYKEIQPNE